MVGFTYGLRVSHRENGIDPPWPSGFELEVKAELAGIIEHQRRTDRLLMELQLELRRSHREVIARFDELKLLLVQLAGNGHG